MSFENPTPTHEPMNPDQKPSPSLIETPADITESLEEMRAANEARSQAELADARAKAAAIAKSIDDSRPEGVASTLPTGEDSAYRFVGVSNVHSGRGIRIDTRP